MSAPSTLDTLPRMAGVRPGKVGVLAKLTVSVISMSLLNPSPSESRPPRPRMAATDRSVASTARP